MTYIPPPGPHASAAIPSFGSNFLTAAGSGLAKGLASGAFGGTSHRKMRRDHRIQLQNQYKHGYLPTARHGHKQWKRQQQWYRKNIAMKALQDRVKDARAAGVHPLVAMGLTPAAGGPAPSSGQMGTGYTNQIPGQSDFGSAIETGINTYLDQKHHAQRMADLAETRAHAKSMGRLQVIEQKLRNDWLNQQIENSKRKGLAATANSTQPGPRSIVELSAIQPDPPYTDEPLVTVAKPPEHTPKGAGLKIGPFTIRPKPGGVTAQGLEDQYGELISWGMSPLLFVRDIGYTIDRYYWNPRKKDWAKGRQSIDPYSP